jgi:hypothetical protein
MPRAIPAIPCAGPNIREYRRRHVQGRGVTQRSRAQISACRKVVKLRQAICPARLDALGRHAPTPSGQPSQIRVQPKHTWDGPSFIEFTSRARRLIALECKERAFSKRPARTRHPCVDQRGGVDAAFVLTGRSERRSSLLIPPSPSRRDRSPHHGRGGPVIAGSARPTRVRVQKRESAAARLACLSRGHRML